MLDRSDCVLLVIDVQQKLAELMTNKDELLRNIAVLIQGVRELGIPVFWFEQYPKGLGRTVEQIAEHLKGLEPIEKTSFSCSMAVGFESALKHSGRRQIIICGIEAHVCVYQTAMDLAAGGYEVEVVGDAVSSRTPENRKIALDKLSAKGIGVGSVEMVLFELLRDACDEKFRAVSKLLK